MSAQLAGVGGRVNIMRVEPIASAMPVEVAALVGPTIDRYMAGGQAPEGVGTATE